MSQANRPEGTQPSIGAGEPDLTRRVPRSWGWVLTVATLVVGAVYLWSQRDALQDVSLDNPWALATLVAVLAVNLVASNEMNLLMVNRAGADMRRAESFWVTWIATLLNGVTPARAGAAFRAVYMKRKHGLTYAAFASTVLGYYVAVAFVAASLTAVTLLVVEIEGSEAVQLAAWLVLILVLVAVSLPRVRSGDGWLRGRLADFTGRWRDQLRRPGELARIAFLALVQVLSSIGALWSAASAIGLDLTVGEAVAIGAAGTLATLVAITPGSLGVYEGTVAITGGLLGASAPLLVVAALVQRLVYVALLSVGALPAYRYLGAGRRR
jgi:uncharacterized membrane protein YbhN (UPF0104 family)